MPKCGALTTKGGKCQNNRGTCQWHGKSKIGTCATYKGHFTGDPPGRCKIGWAKDENVRAKKLGQAAGREFIVDKVVRGPSCQAVEAVVHANLKKVRLPCQTKACACGCKKRVVPDGGSEMFQGPEAYMEAELVKVRRQFDALNARCKR